MRSLQRNSPEAAARIVALVLISDGNVSRSEIDALHAARLEPELGLLSGEFGGIVHQLCEDLLASSYGSTSLTAAIDDQMLAALLAEVDAPELQTKVVTLAGLAAKADKHLSDAEVHVLRALHRHWWVPLTEFPNLDERVVA
jgi:hypothetical protein